LKAVIARGRSCASILIIPGRKMSLSIIGSSPERRKEEGREGTAWGRHGGSCIGEGSRPFTRAALFMRALCSVASVCCVCSAPTWEEENSMKEKRRKRRKRIREGKKKKKWEKFINTEIFGKIIKDNLWSWPKIIFIKERNTTNYNLIKHRGLSVIKLK
jgi:hypothetical protein